MSLIIGRYNVFGYAVYDMDGGNQIYSAGNSQLDSQIWIDIDDAHALPLATIREFCEQTTREIAENAGAKYGGIEHDDSGGIP